VEAGHDAAAAQVEHTRLGTDEALGVRGAADENDAIANDGKCLGCRLFLVHGPDFRVKYDKVGRQGRGLTGPPEKVNWDKWEKRQQQDRDGPSHVKPSRFTEQPAPE